MQKNFKCFIITWIVGVVLFNAVTFLIPNAVFGITRFDKGVFWVAYALIVLSFVVQLLTAYKFVREDGNEKTFFNIPLLRTGYIAVVVSIFVGLTFMLFPVMPTWIGAIVCLVIAGYFAIACVNATTVANAVSYTGKRVKESTAFIKNAVIESANLIARATTEEIRFECQKVYDAFRFSDYVSTARLANIEQEITGDLKKLTFAVGDANYSAVKSVSGKLLADIKERNTLSKRFKGNKN